MGRTVIQNNDSPFYFPEVGQKKMENGAAESGSTIEMLTATGQGVVREIQVIMENSADTAIVTAKNVILNIAYDGSGSPSVSIPIGSFFGYEKSDTVVANAFETPFFSVTTPPQANDGWEVSLILNYPIPYTNGIHIYLTTQGGVDASTTFWWNVIYNNELAPTWNRNLRFLASRTSENTVANISQTGTVAIAGTAVTGVGTSFSAGMIGKYLMVGITDYLITAVADTTHMTIAAVDSTTVAAGAAWKLVTGHDFLSRPAGKKGWVASVVGGMDSDAFTYLEANTRIRLDQELQSSLAWSGTEDFFLGAFYWSNKTQNGRAGIVCFDVIAFSVTAYRIFYNDPIRYVNGVKGVQPNVHSSIVANAWTTVYYEEVPVN